MLVGHIRGGLGIVTILGCMFFASMIGSGPGTVAAMGSIMIPSMIKRGYSPEYAAGVSATGGTLGILIPPSNPMIIYGVVANTSIAGLFMAGFIPGFVMTTSMCITAYCIARKRGYKGTGEKFSVYGLLKAIWDGKWALATPAIILGGIYGGVFTPTEAAAVSVVYGLVVGVFIYREVKMKDMIDILVDSGKTTGGIMLIIGAATLFSYVCTVFGIAQAAQALLLQIAGNKYIFLLIVNVIFLIAGCFVDANSAMYIFIPIMYPVATQLGIDPVHFGVIATVNLAIGQVTPPVGVNLFVAIGVSEKLRGLRDKTKVTIVSMSKAVWPQIVACVITLLIVTYVPWFSTVLLFGK